MAQVFVPIFLKMAQVQIIIYTRVYSLGYFNYVFDYEEIVDPVEIILAFMTVKIRTEEVKRNRQKGHKGGLWIEDVIADIKDVF